MKNIQRITLALALCLLVVVFLPLRADAATIDSGSCGDNVTWTLTSDGVLTLTGTGPMDDYVYLSGGSGMHPWKGYEEEIKSIIIGEGITHIGEYAFCELERVKTVSIPASVQSLGRCAFLECSSLTGPIVIPDGVTEISYRLFMQCNNLTGVTLPNSVTLIDGGAFQACFALQNITIPAGVTDIGEAAFNGCKLLTEVVLPENLTVLRASLFGGCIGLREITIPENVTVIQDMVFYGCEGLREVTIPKNVTFIDTEAFGKCANLKSVTFTGAAPQIGEFTFRDVTATVTYPGDLDGWDIRANQNYGGSLTWTIYCSGTHNSTGGTITREPTCTEPGEKTGICDLCGASYTRPIPPGGAHAFGEPVETTPPTCSENGIMTATCTRCGETEETFIQPLGHTYGPKIHNEGTATHYRVCSICEYVLTLSCIYDTGEVLSEATLTTPGKVRYTCVDCSGIYEETEFCRIFGANRYETAFSAADMLKAQLGVDKFGTIIVASGLDFADALTGSYLAAVKSAPILLVNQHFMDEAAAYINENLAAGGRVYLLGGELAIAPAMEEMLTGHDVVRLAGANRLETNLLILNEAGVGDEEILVCYSHGFADSLSASAVGKPILMVNRGLTPAQKEFLAAADRRFVIIGGESAVSADIEALLQQYGTTERIGGSNRYETSINVAKRFFENPEAVVLAYGANFPDGLCGGPLAYSVGAPLILTRDVNARMAAAYTAEFGISNGSVLGGTGLISDESVNTILAR